MKLDLDPDNLVPLIRRIAQEVCKQFDGGQRRQGAPLAYTEPDAARLLGVKPHVLRDLRLRGQIEASKIGRRIVYTERSLLEFLERSRWEGN